MTLRITGPQTRASIENNLLKVAVRNAHAELQIPVNPRGREVVGELGLAQIIITWARNNEEAVLVTHIQQEEEPAKQLKRMAERMSGFVGLMMAGAITDQQKTQSLKSGAFKECEKVVSTMDGPIREYALGTRYFLICVDHSTKWAMSPLYTGTKKVKDATAFASLVKGVGDKVTHSKPKHQPIPSQSIYQFGEILQELFNNTHDWARNAPDGSPWRRSVRGLSVEWHSWDRTKIQEIIEHAPPLGEYLKTLTIDNQITQRSRFIEFTVFDSGSGLARRWLNLDRLTGVGLDREYAACMECLEKHKSTSGVDYRGLGLANVMQLLSRLRGFLTIRTGRLALYRDFAKRPLIERDLDESLYDYDTMSTNMTELAEIYGTHYQILIPEQAASE